MLQRNSQVCADKGGWLVEHGHSNRQRVNNRASTALWYKARDSDTQYPFVSADEGTISLTALWTVASLGLKRAVLFHLFLLSATARPFHLGL